MKVGIDLTALMPKATGVDTYLLGIARHIGRVDSQSRYTIFVNSGDAARLGEQPGNVTIRTACVRSRAARLLFQQAALPAAASAGGYDVVHSPSFLMPAWRGRSRHLLSVHDMTFFSLGSAHSRLRRSKLFLHGVASSIRRAHLISVPSQTTRDELVRLLPEVPARRIRIVPYGIDARFTPAANGEAAAHLARLGVTRPYILFVGTIEPRKNLGTLLASYRSLLQSDSNLPDLVLAGGFGWDVDDIRRDLGAVELRDRVRALGYVADADLPWLYRGASLFVYPSLFEGFGFPPLEAMACGTPVIAADNSSLREYLQGAAELIPSKEPKALATAIQDLLGNAERRGDLSQRGLRLAAHFGWEATARLTSECYRELASQGRP